MSQLSQQGIEAPGHYSRQGSRSSRPPQVHSSLCPLRRAVISSPAPGYSSHSTSIVCPLCCARQWFVLEIMRVNLRNKQANSTVLISRNLKAEGGQTSITTTQIRIKLQFWKGLWMLVIWDSTSSGNQDRLSPGIDAYTVEWGRSSQQREPGKKTNTLWVGGWWESEQVVLPNHNSSLAENQLEFSEDLKKSFTFSI